MTTSDTEWQRVTTSYNECQWVTTNRNEWQQMNASSTTKEYEWGWEKQNAFKFQNEAKGQSSFIQLNSFIQFFTQCLTTIYSAIIHNL